MRFAWKVVGLIAAAMLMASMYACHTVHGAGEDIEQTGQAIERASD